MVCFKPFVSLVVWWDGDECRSCNRCFNSRGLLFCCTKLKTTWWRHHLILAWTISGKGHWKGHLISTQIWKSNIQAVYPFSTPECKNGKSRRFVAYFIVFFLNEKGKCCHFLMFLFFERNIHGPRCIWLSSLREVPEIRDERRSTIEREQNKMPVKN